MLSSVRSFLTRHRRKFIVTGVIVGGTYIALRYAQRKLIELQEQKAREFFENSRRVQHFESTERTCNQVIISMGTELCAAILRDCSTDDILEKLLQNPSNKRELWEEMKIVSITRLTTLIYASSMLAVTLRVQLNLLGGYLYRDITTEQKQISDELKQQYLSIIRYFLQEGGLKALLIMIREKVTQLIKAVPLNQRFTLNDLEQLFWSLQMTINSDGCDDPNSKMAKYMLPTRLPTEFDAYGASLERMFNETLDILESDDASSVCAHNVCRGFSIALDAIAESFGDMKSEQTSNGNSSRTASSEDDVQLSAASNHQIFNPNTVELALAKIIPILSGLTSHGFDAQSRPQNLATSLITFYVVAEKCKMLGANIYESFATS